MKNSRKAIQSRQNEVLKLLREKKKLGVNEIAKYLEVNPATIRRDLVYLEESGFVRRNFGSAEICVPNSMLEIEPTNVEDENELLRRRIAKQAAQMVDDGDVLYVNSSGTASLVLEYLDGKRVTVFTNNARIITRKPTSNVHVHLVGGELYGKKQSLIGQFALDTISHVVATKCIMGVSGISPAGLTSVILPETQINMRMLEQCNGMKIVVADNSKVGVTQIYYSGSLGDITHLVTDTDANEQSVRQIENAGVTVVRA